MSFLPPVLVPHELLALRAVFLMQKPPGPHWSQGFAFICLAVVRPSLPGRRAHLPVRAHGLDRPPALLPEELPQLLRRAALQAALG